MLLLLIALGCNGHTTSAPETAATSTSQTQSAPEEAPPAADTPKDQMVRLLSARDAAPPCSEVEALSQDPVADLRDIVKTVSMPPTAPMRAAECLIRGHAEAAEADLVSWMQGPETKGLAMLLADRIDVVPMPVAEHVVAAGLAGPHAALVKERVGASADPTRRALVEGAP